MPEDARAELREALNEESLVNHYQPIHDIATRRVVSAESLLRVLDADGDAVQAGDLAAAAEHGPDLVRLDQWSLHSAFSDAARWQRRNGKVRVNVNLSPREFEKESLVARIDGLVEETGVRPDRVNLEITETSYIREPAETVTVLEQLKERGFELWLDDFGTGHSSIEHLQHFPLDGIKIPGGFIREITGNRRCCSIVHGVVALAKDLGLSVVCEEVENEEQLEFVRRAGADFIQGFLFSRAMPVEAFIELLGSQAQSLDPPPV
jgi:EAL domain-containing protein (putative c-di-GMP-specific phosphodiesterase class I)